LRDFLRPDIRGCGSILDSFVYHHHTAVRVAYHHTETESRCVASRSPPRPPQKMTLEHARATEQRSPRSCGGKVAQSLCVRYIEEWPVRRRAFLIRVGVAWVLQELIFGFNATPASSVRLEISENLGCIVPGRGTISRHESQVSGRSFRSSGLTQPDRHSRCRVELATSLFSVRVRVRAETEGWEGESR
jgi:hypothetical protein